MCIRDRRVIVPFVRRRLIGVITALPETPAVAPEQVRDVARDDNRSQSLVLGVVNSYPFMNRTVATPESTAASLIR